MDNNFPFNHFIKPQSNKSHNFKDLGYENKNTNPSVLNEMIGQEQPKIAKNNVDNSSHLLSETIDFDFSEEEIKILELEIHNFLKSNVSDQKYKAFFEDVLTVKTIKENKVYLMVTTPFIKKVLENQYFNVILDCIESTLGKRYSLVFQLVSEKQDILPKSKEFKKAEVNRNDSDESGPLYTVSQSSNAGNTRFTINDLNPTKEDLINRVNSQVINHLDKDNGITIDTRKTFENFIVGHSNSMAHASCIAVAENPGKVYPSLFLYSGSGLGKSHLLHAVANHIRNTKPELRIKLITARDFMDETVKAVQTGKREQLKKKYSQNYDVLMIDDIHELKSKWSTQDEFFHIFNELYKNKKQLIFTSDQLPKDLGGIEERIKSRLSWGLVTDIQMPDLETRIAILKHKALVEDIHVPDDVVGLIASSIKSNIRELEGSLIKLGAYSSIFNVDIDIEIAKKQLMLTDDTEIKNITIESIAKTTSQYFKIPIVDIRSKARQKDVTLARHLAMYLSYTIINSTLTEIGKYYGDRDHTTVLHAIQKIKKRIKDDTQLSTYAFEIENNL